MQKFSKQLRQLVDEYYHQQMPLEVYRSQRKLILDQIEAEYANSNQAGENQKSSTALED